jgi:hypothetical protein
VATSPPGVLVLEEHAALAQSLLFENSCWCFVIVSLLYKIRKIAKISVA